jgi:hypothetical protein
VSVDAEPDVRWIQAGVIAGFLSCVIYPLVIFGRPPLPAAATLIAAFGPLLALASVGLQKLLGVHRRTVAAEAAALLNALGGALFSTMLLIQLAVPAFTGLEQVRGEIWPSPSRRFAQSRGPDRGCQAQAGARMPGAATASACRESGSRPPIPSRRCDLGPFLAASGLPWATRSAEGLDCGREGFMGRVAIGLAAFVIVGCTSIRPVPVQAGDVCARCQRTVVDARLAGEIIDAQGGVLKFRAPLCMAKYLRQHPAEAAAIFVTDYNTGDMFPAMNATFVKVTLEGSEREYAAFQSPTEAGRFMKENGGGVVDWIAVQRVAMEATN